MDFSVSNYRDRILVLWRSLDADRLFGSTAKDGIDSIIKRHTNGRSLLTPSDAPVEGDEIDVKRIWEEILLYLNSFVMDHLERDSKNILKDIKREGGESDLLLQRFYETHSLLTDPLLNLRVLPSFCLRWALVCLMGWWSLVRWEKFHLRL